MTSRRLAVGILASLLCIAVVQNAWYWSQLPPKVATHFDAAGQPDRWMSRPSAVGVMLFFQVGIPLFIVATARLSAILPESMINMPHRQYWLAPERRAATLNRVAATMDWVAVLVSCLMMSVNHLTFVANRDGLRLNSGRFIAAIGLFLVSMLVLVVRMLRHFGRGARGC